MSRTLWVEVIISTSQHCTIQDRIHPLIPSSKHKTTQTISDKIQSFERELEREKEEGKKKDGHVHVSAKIEIDTVVSHQRFNDSLKMCTWKRSE
jgi:hypothetical protein